MHNVKNNDKQFLFNTQSTTITYNDIAMSIINTHQGKRKLKVHLFARYKVSKISDSVLLPYL